MASPLPPAPGYDFTVNGRSRRIGSLRRTRRISSERLLGLAEWTTDLLNCWAERVTGSLTTCFVDLVDRNCCSSSSRMP